MFLSYWGFFRCHLEIAHRPGPHLVEVGAQPRHTFRIQLIEPARSGPAVENESRILQDLQVLGDCGPAYGQCARQLVDGQRAGRQLLKDGHPGRIAQCIQSGL